LGGPVAPPLEVGPDRACQGARHIARSGRGGKALQLSRCPGDSSRVAQRRTEQAEQVLPKVRGEDLRETGRGPTFLGRGVPLLDVRADAGQVGAGDLQERERCRHRPAHSDWWRGSLHPFRVGEGCVRSRPTASGHLQPRQELLGPDAEDRPSLRRETQAVELLGRVEILAIGGDEPRGDLRLPVIRLPRLLEQAVPRD
jgi:hypothetical protein